MTPEDFNIAIITALPVELACVKSMLDETFEDIPRLPRDDILYTYGKLGKHNIVVTSLPSGVTANVSAAVVAGRVRASFPNLEFGLMVGVGGGVPQMEYESSQDVRLGDVVVGNPTETFGGVVKFEQGKIVRGSREDQPSYITEDVETSSTFVRTGALGPPPNILLTAVANLRAKHYQQASEAPQYLEQMFQKYPVMKETFSYLGSQRDLLFQANYDHPKQFATCKNCDPSRLVDRPTRKQSTPIVHYGTILTGDVVMKSGIIRERLARQYNALCIEMEAAGVSSTFPCLVIRGICDYADSHKNKDWQPYAAAVAAAYAKELLGAIPPLQNDKEPALSQSTKAAQGNTGPSNTIYGNIRNSGGSQFVGGTFNGPMNFSSSR